MRKWCEFDGKVGQGNRIYVALSLHRLWQCFKQGAKLPATLRLYERKLSPTISSVSPAVSSAKASATRSARRRSDLGS